MPSQPLPRRPPRWRAAAVLAAVWAFCCALELGKAVHVDDTAHLVIAEHIVRDPLHPMRAEVFWGVAPAPAHELNQPHLFFYLLAGLMALGAGPLGLQLAMCALTGLALVATYRLVRRAAGDETLALFAAAALGLGPALAPSQNLMTDVPLLALFTVALASFVGPGTDRRSVLRLALGAAAVGLACLVKYTGLVLLPVLAWWLWRHRRRSLWVLAIPIAFLAAWSAFNVWDYGGVHLFGRRISVAEDAPGLPAMIGLTAGRGALWVLTLGAMSPFTLAWAPRAAARFGGRRILVGSAVALPLLTLGGQLLAAHGPDVLRGETVIHSFLRGLFFANGVLVLALSFGAARRAWASPIAQLLGWWILGITLFIVVLSPFVAVRHVLLVLPPTLALLALDPEHPTTSGTRTAALALSLVIGLGVGVADWRTADAYRALPARLEASLAGAPRVLFLGHWGFQRYATAAGWTPYVPGQTELRPGDVLVRPANVDHPAVVPEDEPRLRLRRTVILEAGPLDLFRTVTSRLGYYSVWHGLPWTLTLEPIDRVDLLEVAQPSQPSTPISGT
ncbi:MAG: glycosyltransferase family 39 protein [Sandaracinaceae bacterium]